MWYLGHIAIGYFIACGISRAVGKRFQAKLLPFVFLLAISPDFVHFGFLHMAGHNFIGGTLISLFIVLIISRFLPLEKWEAVTLWLVGFTHFIGDVLFSTYYPLIPFDFDVHTIYNYHSSLAISTALVVCIVFLMVFFFSGDLSSLKGVTNSGIKRFFSSDCMKNELVKPEYIPGFAFLLFLATAILETGLYIVLVYDRYGITPGKVSLIVLMVLFLFLLP